MIPAFPFSSNILCLGILFRPLEFEVTREVFGSLERMQDLVTKYEFYFLSSFLVNM